MKTRHILIVCSLFVTLSVAAQKKELNQAETYLKSGKDFDKAEKLMTDLLKTETNRENKKIYLMWYRAVEAQYEAANEKLYLQQKYDTTQFFTLVRRMYQVAESLDSLDARPNKKGKIHPDYRRRHAERLNLLRFNLFNGGAFQLRKQQYDDAYSFFDTYIATGRQPLFQGYNYDATDPRMPQAAYWATQCAYKLQRPDSVLRHANLALRDTSRHEHILQYVCEAYLWQQNDSALVATLRQGVSEFPEHPYFFPRLADWYSSHAMPDSVLVMADRCLKTHPDNQLFLLAKSVAQLDLNQDNSCIVTSKRLIALNDTLPQPHYNIAMVYLNKALELEEHNEPRKNHARLQELYRLAKPYMETYRKLAPDDGHRWAPALYRIYLNLNMGRQFDEIDRLLRTMK